MTLTVADAARYPRPGTAIPARISYAPDGRSLTFLASQRGDLSRDLWRLDLATGQRALAFVPPDEGVTDQNVSPEEALRRERLRLRETGVTDYVRAGSAPTMLVPLRGELYRVETDQPPERLTAGAIDPTLSRDGRRVYFVRDAEVWCLDWAPGAASVGYDERRLTSGAEPGLTNGLAEYVAQEELGRQAGYWPSPDGAWVAFAQVDQRHVPVYPIVHQGKDRPEVEEHRYPFAGAANARVHLGVVSTGGGEPSPAQAVPVREREQRAGALVDPQVDNAAAPALAPSRPASGVWLDLGAEDLYLARVDWYPDGRLLVQLLSRDQRRLDLWAYSVPDGERRLLLTEQTDPWVNLHADLRVVEPTGEIVWSSERTGFRHLYLLDPEGRVVRQLTHGDWAVDAVCGLDAANRQLYFTAGRPSPLERRVFGVSLDGGEVEELTPEPGWHDAVFALDCSSFVDTHDALDQPPRVTVRGLDGAIRHVLHAPEPRPDPPRPGPPRPGPPRPEGTRHPAPGTRHPAPGTRYPVPGVQLDLAPPELHTLTSRDGVPLHAALYQPPGGATTATPLLVSVYGGPHAQMVRDTWLLTVDLRAQLLAQEGFLVLKLDNRGSARRGLAFEAPIWRDMGEIELRDQIDGVRWVIARGLADPDRVGIYGWSYGGYLSALALVKAPEVFTVAVAGAPVTSWDGYDTGYTERYMGTPQENPEGYRRSSVLTHVDRLAGKLLLIHGMIDENVHFRHTARLVDALIKANRRHDLLIYPNERHMPRSERDRTAMEQQILDYVRRHLS